MAKANWPTTFGKRPQGRLQKRLVFRENKAKLFYISQYCLPATVLTCLIFCWVSSLTFTGVSLGLRCFLSLSAPWIKKKGTWMTLYEILFLFQNIAMEDILYYETTCTKQIKPCVIDNLLVWKALQSEYVLSLREVSLPVNSAQRVVRSCKANV